MKTKEEVWMIRKNIKKIEEEYKPKEELFCENVETNEILKKVWSLEESDRRVLILYAEIKSHRKVAEILQVSEFSIRKKLKQIKKMVA